MASPHHQTNIAEGLPNPSISSLPAKIDPAAVREQLERILSDSLFRKSKRYTDLLRFIVERTLDGKFEDLRERMIGFELFGRAPDYDVSIDPMVRVVANEVRKRLALYYRGPIHEKELVIEVPLGGYAAEFQLPGTVSTLTASDSSEQATGTQDSLFKRLRLAWPDPAPHLQKVRQQKHLLLWLSLMTVVLLLLGWGGLRFVYPRSVLDQFWEPLSGQARPLQIYIGTSSTDLQTIGSLQDSSAPLGTAQANANNQVSGLADCCANVSMLDVRVGQAFASFLRNRKSDSLIRPAHGATFADLSAAPSMSIGLNNEWLLRLGSELPYHFRQDAQNDLQWIADSQNPSNQQWRSSLSIPHKTADWDYALVSRIHDPSTGHWWIGVAGFSGDATARAQEFLIDQTAMNELSPQLPLGWKYKNLQIVLKIRVVQGSPGRALIAAVRSW